MLLLVVRTTDVALIGRDELGTLPDPPADHCGLAELSTEALSCVTAHAQYQEARLRRPRGGAIRGGIGLSYAGKVLVPDRIEKRAQALLRSAVGGVILKQPVRIVRGDERVLIDTVCLEKRIEWTGTCVACGPIHPDVDAPLPRTYPESRSCELRGLRVWIVVRHGWAGRGEATKSYPAVRTRAFLMCCS